MTAFSTRPRVTFVIDSFMVGGTELAALRTYSLLRSEADISLVHFHTVGPLFDEYRVLGAQLHHVQLYGVSDPRNVIAIAKLRKLLTRLRPQVIHSHDAYSNMVVLGTQIPWRTAPWISSRRWLDQIVRPSHARLNHVAFQRSSAVTVNSRAVAEHMTAVEGIASTRITVVPNFVELPELMISRKPAGTPVVIGMVSRLTPIKRHDLALRALRIIRDEGHAVQLVIVGEGIARAEIEGLIRTLGLDDCVRLDGERRGGPALHQNFDITLTTSDSEGSPNSVLEAMAAARPVVATDVGGTRDLIRPAVDGFLVPAGNVNAIADALRTLVASAATRKSMGTSARERAAAEFSPAAIATALLSLYQRLSR